MSLVRSLGRDLSLRSPCVEYRLLLKEMIQESGKTQRQVAEEAEIEPGNLSHICAGDQYPLLDPDKNRKLAKACGRPEAAELQFLAEACHGIRRQPEWFRRCMAVAVRVLEQLAEKAELEMTALQDLYKRGEVPLDELRVPQSLLAIKYVTQSLREWWPLEEHARWDDYQGVAESFRRRVGGLPLEEQILVIVRAEIEEALDWVYSGGDLDPEIEADELIRRLAQTLGVDREALEMAVRGVERAGRKYGSRPRGGKPPRPVLFGEGGAKGG